MASHAHTFAFFLHSSFYSVKKNCPSLSASVCSLTRDAPAVMIIRRGESPLNPGICPIPSSEQCVCAQEEREARSERATLPEEAIDFTFIIISFFFSDLEDPPVTL